MLQKLKMLSCDLRWYDMYMIQILLANSYINVPLIYVATKASSLLSYL